MAREAKAKKPSGEETKPKKQQAKNKQAVVVIHGMGEQRPMETLRSFVETVWTKDLSLTGGVDNKTRIDPETGLKENKVWIVPDARAGTHELRRITTPGDKARRRTDFFEFYWADVMQGTTLQQLWAWLRGLLFRSPATVPRDVFGAWILLIALSAITVIFAIVAAIPPDQTNFLAEKIYNVSFKFLVDYRLFLCTAAAFLALLVGAGNLWDGRPLAGVVVKTLLALALIVAAFAVLEWEAAKPHPRIWAVGISAAIGVIVHSFIVPTFGDVARYVRAAPDTVEKREVVRNRGLALLNGLHDSGDYDRIIVVGHSLGSILAYDLVQLLWAERAPSPANPPDDETVEAFGKIDAFVQRRNEDWNDKERRDFRAAQGDLGRLLRSVKKPWLISDFVTIGSPLTHAEFLVARDESELARSIRDRLLSKCPPEPDETLQRGGETVLYKGPARTPRFPHHAAVFAPTRWTNIHDPKSLLLFGDIISGSLKANFGRGIEEYQVKIERPFLFGLKWRFFTHTLYWRWRGEYDNRVADHIEVLRKAVALEEI